MSSRISKRIPWFSTTTDEAKLLKWHYSIEHYLQIQMHVSNLTTKMILVYGFTRLTLSLATYTIKQAKKVEVMRNQN